MTRPLAIIAAVLLAAPPSISAESGEPGSPAPASPVLRTPHLALHLAGIGLAIGAYALSETVAKDALAPDACRWCTPPGLDAAVRRHLLWHDPAAAGTLSNLTGYALSPLAALGLLFVAGSAAPDRWQRFADDTLAVAEAAAYTQLAVQAIKFSAGRQRPFVHVAPLGRAPDTDDNLSFPSGHSALAFSLATAAGSVAQRRHAALAPAIWAIGLGLAATTAYLRIAADKHYVTDVLAGSALGTAGGLFLPRLTGSLPADLIIAPAPSGVAILGSF
ncbi:MAG TPA: phosphatase PAP2 family protein [Kofleriaceae bacterium]